MFVTLTFTFLLQNTQDSRGGPYTFSVKLQGQLPPPPAQPELAQVKRAYHKALLVVHPDKNRGDGPFSEQPVLAAAVFDTLVSAWQHFSEGK